MENNAFSQLTESERLQKFDTVIRKNTANLLQSNPELAKVLQSAMVPAD